MKKLLYGLILCLSISLCACGKTAKPSDGLEITTNGDGTCLLSGIGSCADTNLIVPEKSPDGDLVVGVGGYAFSYLDLTSVTLPDSVKKIESYAFSDLEKLKDIKMGSITELEISAFHELPALKNVTIGDGIKYYQAISINEITPTNDEKQYYVVSAGLTAYAEEPALDMYTEANFITAPVTRDNEDFVFCSLFDQEKIEVNGKSYSMPDLDIPSGTYQGSMLWQFAFDENLTYKMTADGTVLFEGTYSLNEETGCYLIENGGLVLNFVCHDDSIYLYGRFNEAGTTTILSGVMKK